MGTSQTKHLCTALSMPIICCTATSPGPVLKVRHITQWGAVLPNAASVHLHFQPDSLEVGAARGLAGFKTHIAWMICAIVTCDRVDACSSCQKSREQKQARSSHDCSTGCQPSSLWVPRLPLLGLSFDCNPA